MTIYVFPILMDKMDFSILRSFYWKMELLLSRLKLNSNVFVLCIFLITVNVKTISN